MERPRVTLYHIHRNGLFDDLWKVEKELVIDNKFNNELYKVLNKEHELLKRRYGNYDIDYIISMMEEIKFQDQVIDNYIDKFNKTLNRFYILRREFALEEGRIIFSPDSPSRMHSIFLTEETDLPYWINLVGREKYNIYELELDGNLFFSSDDFFPDQNLPFDLQVEKSKDYWQPKSLSLHKEYLFSGKAKIIK